MTDVAPIKPTRVVLIGWFLIFVALISIFGIIGDYNKVSIIPEPIKAVYYAIGLILSILLLVASIGFLKLKKWSRSTLEFLTWVHLAESLLLPIMMVGVWPDRIALYVESVVAHPPNENELTFFTVFIALFCAILFIIGAMILFMLRSDKVRNAVIY